jgi:hypothetical protein
MISGDHQRRLFGYEAVPRHSQNVQVVGNVFEPGGRKWSTNGQAGSG